ncbi:MAG: hypothetical protein LBQ38_12655 [Spirochaetaceae bacterium]|jgi:hypothetical protein|nr:hypothetical protein [Spirochaetaceae bacterium]
MEHSEKPGERDSIFSEDPSFEEVLDHTCERLWDKKVRYSLRRIQEMEDTLGKMEQELDEALS